MHVGKLFDQALVQIEDGALATGLYGLSGALNLAQNDTNEWPAMRAALHDHDLHNLLLEDPYINRARLKPRGYAGDAKLIDFIYDRNPPQKTGQRGRDIFEVTTAFPVSESVRFRRDLMADKLDDAWRAGKRICSLACGHFREGDNLIGEDLSNITLVDQDDLSLATIEGRHGANVRIVQGNVFQFLRSAKMRGERFDMIYTLGLTDYLDDRAMRMLHKMMKACLAPGGEIFLANFMPYHLARGWMDAVMDWHLIYRTGEEMEQFAREIELNPRLHYDPSRSIVFCEMTKPRR